MPEGTTSGPSGPQANRVGKGKSKDRERNNREESEGDSKDNVGGNGAGTGNASEGKGGSGINRVNSEYTCRGITLGQWLHALSANDHSER